MASQHSDRASGVDSAVAAVIAALGTVAVAVFAQVQIKDERSTRQHTEEEQRSAEIRKQAEQVTGMTGCDGQFRLPH